MNALIVLWRFLRNALPFAVILFLLPALSWAGEPRTLVVLTWSEYMDPEVVAAFEAEHDARVRFVYFESDAVRDEVLADTDGAGYDVLLLDNTVLGPYRSRGWLAPVSPQDVPNLGQVERRWLDAYPQSSGYAVPYFWGTLGIAYREDLVPGPLTAWRDLYRPDEALKGRILMARDTADLVGMALKSLGHSMNSADPHALAEAERLLLEQRPFVARYGTLALGEDSALVRGEVAAAMTYSGDALTLQGHDERIRYLVPEEGSALWVDYLAIAASSPRKDLATAFIDFVTRPDMAARNAQYLNYDPPSAAARALLPADYRDNPLIYPPPEVLARCEFYAELPPRAWRARAGIFSRVTSRD